jgi:hypothetical protein
MTSINLVMGWIGRPDRVVSVVGVVAAAGVSC